MNSKQIIILRKFPDIPIGKYASQAAHASMSFLTRHGGMINEIDWGSMTSRDVYEKSFRNTSADIHKHYEAISHWLDNSFRKIVCVVETEQELLDIHEKAKAHGLMSHLVEDNGATIFNGQKTTTALAIGPHWDKDFDGITDKLPLF